MLAAGASRRFGRADKLFAPLRGVPLVLYAIRAACDAPADRVIVVAGDPGRVRSIVRAAGLRRVRVICGRGRGAPLSDTLRAGVAAHVATMGEAGLREVLRDVEAGARDSLAELTGVLRRERADVGFAQANGPVVELSAALADVARTAERTGMRTHLNVTGNVGDLPAALSTTIQRLAQESVTNAARHAEAASLTISVSVLTDRVDLEVHDDGHGATAGLRSGHGLTGMRERVALVGGTLRIHPGPPGFTVSASIPLAAPVDRGTSL